jgi:hypothetical protein
MAAATTNCSMFRSLRSGDGVALDTAAEPAT